MLLLTIKKRSGFNEYPVISKEGSKNWQNSLDKTCGEDE